MADCVKAFLTPMIKWYIIAILFIVGFFIVVQIDPVKNIEKTYDAKRKSDLSHVQKALESYYKIFGNYPQSNSHYEIINFKDKSPIAWGFGWDQYMKQLPNDFGGRRYAYYSSPSLQSYWLYASLQIGSDPLACNRGRECLSLSRNKLSRNACGIGFICNFELSSRNVTP